MTSLIVDCADFDQIDADECREQLITVFERLADRCASMEHDVSSMPKAERDIFVDVVWIMDQLVNSADAKDKAKWERLVYTAVNVAVIEKLPPLMRRELSTSWVSSPRTFSAAFRDFLDPPYFLSLKYLLNVVPARLRHKRHP